MSLVERKGKMSKVALKFDFNKAEHAEMCRRVLNVDPELKPQLIHRQITVQPDSTLLITFESKDLRLLRVAVQGILDGVYLLIETLEAFDLERMETNDTATH